jgi:hypothetical protein
MGGKKNSTLRLSTFKLFMLQWKLLGIVLKNIDEYQENSGLITNFWTNDIKFIVDIKWKTWTQKVC